MRLTYNIDGASWIYAGTFDAAASTWTVTQTLVGQGELADGVCEAIDYEVDSFRHALSFSSATEPSQLFVIEFDGEVRKLTNERPVGIAPELLAAG